MAATALFSSFRRPGFVQDEPLAEQAAGAVPQTAPEPQAEPFPDPPGPAQAFLPSEADQPVHLAIPGDKDADVWTMASVHLGADQLGLAHPDVIVLQAMLQGAFPVRLEASTAGIYRPPSSHAAPPDGAVYEQPPGTMTGLAAGTRILTTRGEVEVEELVAGDRAMALRGPALVPIASIGRVRPGAAPIRIEPGALGPDLPRRRIRVGRDQAVFLTPDSVPAHSLVNGTTVCPEEAPVSELFLVDLGRAEIIVADGLAVASSHDGSTRG